MKTTKPLVAVLVVLSLPLLAPADVITFETPEYMTVRNSPVHAAVTFTTDNDLLKIVVENLTPNARGFARAITGLSFQLSTGAEGATLIDSSATMRYIGWGGRYIDATLHSVPWSLDDDGLTLSLSGLAGHCGPKLMLIGPPDEETGRYARGRGMFWPGIWPRIAMAGALEFTVSVPGLTPQTEISDVVFNFGSQQYAISPSKVPEPASLTLLGLGAAGVLLRRKPRP